MASVRSLEHRVRGAATKGCGVGGLCPALASAAFSDEIWIGNLLPLAPGETKSLMTFVVIFAVCCSLLLLGRRAARARGAGPRPPGA